MTPSSVHRFGGLAPPGVRGVCHAHVVARWIANVLLAGIAVALYSAAALMWRGHSPADSLRHTSLGRAASLAGDSHYDSWRPLLRADERMQEYPGTSPYAVFFAGEGKFQYPPFTLFLARRMDPGVKREALARWSGSRLQQVQTWLGRCSLAVTVVLALLIVQHGIARWSSGGTAGPMTPDLAVLVAACALVYFPHLIAHELGQFQLALNALIAASVLGFLTGRKLVAGACAGLCCLVKPHYALLLAWSLLRREHRFTGGLLAVALTGHLAALAAFGWQAHVDYLAVLRLLSRQSEIFWFNQSINGVLHRLADPAGANVFDAIGSVPPAFVGWIFLVGVLVNLGLVTVALVRPRRGLKTAEAQQADFALMLVALTIASPVAWNHHYGAFFPLFFALVPALLFSPAARPWMSVALGTAFVAQGVVLFAPDFMFRTAARGLLLSHLYFGGVLMFVVLVAWRTAAAATATASPAPPNVAAVRP